MRHFMLACAVLVVLFPQGARGNDCDWLHERLVVDTAIPVDVTRDERLLALVRATAGQMHVTAPLVCEVASLPHVAFTFLPKERGGVVVTVVDSGVVKTATSAALTGLVAHELGHVVLYVRLGLVPDGTNTTEVEADRIAAQFVGTDSVAEMLRMLQRVHLPSLGLREQFIGVELQHRVQALQYQVYR